MAASTDNLNLKLPTTSEDYSINDFNTNFTKIDGFAGTVTAAISDTSIIADNTISDSSTYSSSKITTIVGQAQSTANQANSKANTNAAAIEDIEEDVDRVDSTATLALQTGNTANGKADTNASAIDELSDNVEDGSAIGNSAITTDKINDGSVTTAKLSYESVTNVKIAASAVDTGKLANAAVQTAKIANNAVTTAKITDNAVTTAKIADEAVDIDKVSADIASVHYFAKSAAVYTGVPMRIGTWFGGIPIWRLMFQHELTAQEQSDKAYDPISAVMQSAGGTYKSFIINAFATINFSDTPTVVDSAPVKFGGGTWFEWDTAMENPAIYGFVDFVTPAENIID